MRRNCGRRWAGCSHRRKQGRSWHRARCLPAKSHRASSHRVKAWHPFPRPRRPLRCFRSANRNHCPYRRYCPWCPKPCPTPPRSHFLYRLRFLPHFRTRSSPCRRRSRWQSIRRSPCAIPCSSPKTPNRRPTWSRSSPPMNPTRRRSRRPEGRCCTLIRERTSRIQRRVWSRFEFSSTKSSLMWRRRRTVRPTDSAKPKRARLTRAKTNGR